jgi:predicted MFS family arabinose efflux permease
LQHQSRRLAWTSAVIHGLVHASVLMVPPLLGDLQRSFRVSLLELLAVYNAMCLIYGLCAIPAGFLADRFGSRRMLVLAAAGCTLSLLLVAAAPSFLLLALGLVLLGLSAGLYHPSGLSLLSRAVASGERGRAIGIHGAGGNLGEAIAPAWAWWFATTLGWRAGFVAAAALSLVCGLLALTLPASGRPRDETSGPAAPSPSGTLASTLAQLGRTLLGFARNRRLLWLLLSLVAAGFIYRGFLTFLSLHLADRGGVGANASYVMSAVLVAGIVAQRFGGELADRRVRERLYLTVSALAPPLLLLLALGPRLGVIAGALAFGFVWSLAQPVANALTAAYARETDHGLLYGIQFAATFGVGSFASTAGGLLAARGGTPLTFLGLAVVALVQVVAVFALLRTPR